MPAGEADTDNEDGALNPSADCARDAADRYDDPEVIDLALSGLSVGCLPTPSRR